ncbi:MAG TPA: DUF2795 domain-containing protein [Magnetospirillum sp.]|nr:DUF2795 domain-containing protein [Magnetospirillum sp.]
MAARNLVQALEGVSFPCDRARLIEYARNNNLASRALAALEEIPERQYRDLGEVFTALPGRVQPATAASAEEAEPAPEHEPEPEAAGDILASPLEWWMLGWQQAMLPWTLSVHCLRSSAESWPQWMRLGQHILFPWSK